MPHIAMPSAFSDRIRQVDMQLGFPQQSVLRSPWTGAVQTLNRGYSRWSGLVDLRPEAAATDAYQGDWGAIEAFLGSLQGAANTFDLPHRRPPAPLTADTVFAASRTPATGDQAGVLQHRLPYAVPSGLAPGQLLNAGNRTFVIALILAQRWLVLYPQRIIPNTAPANPSSTIRVRAGTSDGVVSPLTSHRSGPWSLPWIEA